MNVSTAPFPKLPYNFARKFGVCIRAGTGDIQLVFTSITPLLALTEARRFAGHITGCREVSTEQFERVLAETYQHDAGAVQRVADDVGETLSLEHIVDSVETGDLLAQEDDAPVIRLINALLMEALRENASDIHIESYEKEVSVRLRVDGVLQEALTLQPRLAPMLISRIKVMASLDISEKRLPQDGRISLRLGSREVDVRVSTMPSGASERVVLRILDKHAGRLDLEHLGMAEHSIQAVNNIITRPHGIILVTGPTGSGKTTTLYAMLSRLNDRTRNILTIEDPVEYQIQGISQSQVNPKIDLTFAVGLRAILRQDPDVVMVGEIRDVETARIAVQASLTGHLVLSTLHTNSAVGAITRLSDMGIEPFLLASSLVGVLAQRLVRKLCPECRMPHEASVAECNFLHMDHSNPPVIYRPLGCTSCRGTGFRGRVSVCEIMTVDETIRTMIHDGTGEQALTQYVHTQSNSMMADGRAKVLQGLTTCDEVMRVTNDM